MRRVRSVLYLLPLALLLALLLACTSSDDAPSPAAVTTHEPPTTVAATQTPLPTPVPGLTPATGNATATLVLDGAPKALPLTTPRMLQPFTPSTLPVPDRQDTVLYDVAANTALNLGPGTMGQFSPDGKYMAWSTQALNNPSEVYLIDLATKERRALALGRDPRWWGQNRVVYFTGGQSRSFIDLTTSQQAPFPGSVVFPDFSTADIDGAQYRLKALPPDPLALTNRNRYAIEDIAAARVVLEFEASQAVPAGRNEMVIATPPVNGMTNLYVVSVPTGGWSFVATTRWLATNWPLSANENHVAWTDAYCDFANPGKTKVYDRRARTFTELDRSFWVRLTPGSKLAPGEFGGKSLIDLSTLRATFVIPGTEMYDRNRDVSWSPDYRFASTGFAGGHGGFCG